MPQRHHERLNRHQLTLLWFAQVFRAVTAALPIYVASSFFSQWVPQARVGLIYTGIFALLLVIMLVIHPAHPRAARRLFLITFAIELLAFSGLALATVHVVAPVLLAVALIADFLAFLGFDMLIESVSTDRLTGRIRGIFMTAMNLGFVASPIVTGRILDTFGYGTLFAICASIGVIPLGIVALALRAGRGATTRRRDRSIAQLVRAVWRRGDLRRISWISFLLFLFYAWMVIYTPLYLRGLGWSWSTIGITFTFMLVPFVILQLPAGWVADRWLGEQELLLVGFLFMAGSVFLLPYASNVLAVTVVLVLSRVGASLVEVLSDVYFLKQIGLEDLELMDVFRLSRPAAYIIGTLLATVLLLWLPITYLFTVLGVTLLSGVVLAARLTDTPSERELAFAARRGNGTR